MLKLHSLSLVDLPRWGLATADDHSNIFLFHYARSCDISFSLPNPKPNPVIFVQGFFFVQTAFHMLDALLSSTKDVVTFFNIMTVLSCGSTTPNQVVISLQVKNRSRSITLHDKTSKAAQWANNTMKNVHKNINRTDKVKGTQNVAKNTQQVRLKTVVMHQPLAWPEIQKNETVT